MRHICRYKKELENFMGNQSTSRQLQELVSDNHRLLAEVEHHKSEVYAIERELQSAQAKAGMADMVKQDLATCEAKLKQAEEEVGSSMCSVADTRILFNHIGLLGHAY